MAIFEGIGLGVNLFLGRRDPTKRTTLFDKQIAEQLADAARERDALRGQEAARRLIRGFQGIGRSSLVRGIRSLESVTPPPEQPAPTDPDTGAPAPARTSTGRGATFVSFGGFGPPLETPRPKVPLILTAGQVVLGRSAFEIAKKALAELAKKEALRKTVERILKGIPKQAKSKPKEPPKGSQKPRDFENKGGSGRVRRERVLEEIGRGIRKKRKIGDPRVGRARENTAPTPPTDGQVDAQAEVKAAERQAAREDPMAKQVGQVKGAKVSGQSPLPFLLTAGVLGTIILAQTKRKTGSSTASLVQSPPKLDPAPTESPPSPITDTDVGTSTDTQLATQTASQLQLRQRTRTKECQEVKRKRKRGKCFEGFYEERRGKTIFTDWRQVDCDTGDTIPKKKRAA